MDGSRGPDTRPVSIPIEDVEILEGPFEVGYWVTQPDGSENFVPIAAREHCKEP
jgi:hypothetical protein